MPELQEIMPGLHRWTADAPDWRPDQGGPEGWGREVACAAWEGEESLVLIDPLVVDDDWSAIDALAAEAGGPVALIITCPWHARSGAAAVRRYVNSPGIAVWAHTATLADTGRIGFDVDHVVDERAQVVPGVEVIATDTGNGELTAWIDAIGAIVAGDVLIGAQGERAEALRVCPSAWLEEANDVDTVTAALVPLLERDVRAIVPLHGAPVLSGAKEALRTALTG